MKPDKKLDSIHSEETVSAARKVLNASESILSSPDPAFAVFVEHLRFIAREILDEEGTTE